MSVGYEFIPSRAILVFQAPENLQADVTLNKTKKLREVPAGSYWCLKALISILKILFLREGWAPISDHYQHFFFYIARHKCGKGRFIILQEKKLEVSTWFYSWNSQLQTGMCLDMRSLHIAPSLHLTLAVNEII